MNPVLRSAQSTPYIRTPGEVIQEKENSNECLSARHREPPTVQFNAGCSSSSSDLNQLLEIYNDLDVDADFGQWLLQYKKERLQDEKNCSFNSETTSINGYEGYLSDSCGNLITPQSCSTQSVRDQACNYVGRIKIHHRSMDILPEVNEGFYALGKAASTDFAPKIMVPPSKLCRSKEMPNILDEDDYE